VVVTAKCTRVIRMLAYGIAIDCVDEYLKLEKAQHCSA